MTKPPILVRLISQLKAKGMSDAQAIPIALAELEKDGILKKGTMQLTAKGLARQKLGAAGRAIDRASKKGSHPASDYKYDKKTNRATLKRSK